MTKMLSLLTISTLLLTSCSGPESSGGVTLSKTEGSSVRGARPNTNHGWSGNHSADRNAQQAAKLKITSPNGGEKWAVGSVQNVEWEKDSKGPHVIIRVYKSKKYVETITRKTKNDGSHSWKLPSSFKTGATFSIKVTSFTYHNACATYADYLTYSPGHGRALVSDKTDTSHYMCTDSSGGAAAKDSCWNSCVSKYGSKNCEVVDVDGNKCTSTASAYDSSDSNFTITKSGGGGSSLKVSTPNGGESWTTGKTQSIKWSKGNAGANVKIELLKSGKKSLTISKKTKNDGKHSWKIPATVATASTYKIKITSSTKKTVSDSSDSNFTITKAAADTCTMKVRVGDSSVTTYHPGKKVCLGKTSTDVVCGTTGGAGPNYWATIKKVPKKSLNIYPCGSKNKYPVHGVDASYCGGTFEIHPWGFGNDYEAKCGF